MRLPPNRPLVYLITQGLSTAENFHSTWPAIIATVKNAVEAGVPLIQLREKHLSAKAQYDLALELVRVTRGSETRLLINDRADIAAAAGADGVHLTATSLDASVVRLAFGSKMLIGISTHSAVDVVKARAGGADFAVIGPIFDSPGKSAELRLPTLGEICTAADPFPLLALGGIDSSNYDSVIKAGAAGFAAIRSLNDPGSLSKIMIEIAQD